MTHGVEGNRLYIICTVCGSDTQHSQMLGMRRGSGYFKAPGRREMEEWFEEHAKCGGTLDHFKLALSKPENWDAAEVIDPGTNTALAVKLALIESGRTKFEEAQAMVDQ